MNPGELETIVALARGACPVARTIIEFGVNSGRTARALLENVPTLVRYVGIDVLPGYVPEKQVQRKEVPLDPGHKAAHDPRFELILRERGSLDLSSWNLPACEVAFIDGDHGREGVLNDTALARSLVMPGGFIIWHDYHGLETVDVRKVLDEFASKGEKLYHVADTWLAFECR
jgi:predicted O-methyltransferase YrrM